MIIVIVGHLATGDFAYLVLYLTQECIIINQCFILCTQRIIFASKDFGTESAIVLLRVGQLTLCITINATISPFLCLTLCLDSFPQVNHLAWQHYIFLVVVFLALHIGVIHRSKVACVYT